MRQAIKVVTVSTDYGDFKLPIKQGADAVIKKLKLSKSMICVLALCLCGGDIVMRHPVYYALEKRGLLVRDRRWSGRAFIEFSPSQSLIDVCRQIFDHPGLRS